jgi:hypothetical protein
MAKIKKVALKPALNKPVVICRTSFSGIVPKNEFYLIFEHIEKLKMDGFKIEKYERIDSKDKITYDYVLCLYSR